MKQVIKNGFQNYLSKKEGNCLDNLKVTVLRKFIYTYPSLICKKICFLESNKSQQKTVRGTGRVIHTFGIEGK